MVLTTYIVACLAGFLATFGIQRQRTTLIILAIVIFPLFFRGLLAYTPSLEISLFNHPLYPQIERYWVAPLVAAILPLVARQVHQRLIRAAALIVGGCAIVGWGALAAYATNADPLEGRVMNGVCRQTTSYSCGPAAAATWLSSYGVNTTEAEMSEACATNPWDGTTTAGLFMGLRYKLGFADLVLEEFEHPPENSVGPWLAVVKLNSIINHWVVIDRIDSTGADVRDPIYGSVRWDRAELERRWKGVLISRKSCAPSSFCR